jgi:hypothetical protein
MLKAYSNLVRFFRMIPPLLHQYQVASYTRSHPSCVLRYGCDKSSPLSPLASYKSLRCCETSGKLFTFENCCTASTSFVFHTLLIRSYSCKKTTDEMACPLRDPASEQLNDWKRKLKVRLLVTLYIPRSFSGAHTISTAFTYIHKSLFLRTLRMFKNIKVRTFDCYKSF